MSEPRRGAFFERLKREFHRLPPVESFLQRRVEWMLKESGIVGDLEKRMWPDPSHMQKIEVLCLGAGKGHEMEAIKKELPGAVVWGVDPHDDFAPPVKERLRGEHEVFYLHESVSAEDLREIPDKTQDAVTFYFVLHHMDEAAHARVFFELNRVLKDDGFVYIAEDLVGSDEERDVTEKIDRRINLELAEGPHAYRSPEDWKMFFNAQGFVVECFHEVKPDKVRHGWFTLRKKGV